MISKTIFYFSLLILSISGEKLHESMTKDEVQSIFHNEMEIMEEINYQIVEVDYVDNNQINDVVQRSAVELRAFEQDYKLYIEENNHVLIGKDTPIFLARRDPAASNENSSLLYERVNNPLPKSFKLFHDVQNRAAITMHTDSDGRNHFNGVIGDNIVIRSLPTRIHDLLAKNSSKYRVSQLDIDSSRYSTPTHHIVIKTDENDINEKNHIKMTQNLHEMPQIPLQSNYKNKHQKMTKNLHEMPQIPLQNNYKNKHQKMTENLHEMPQIPLQSNYKDKHQKMTKNLHEMPQIPLQTSNRDNRQKTTENLHEMPQIPQSDNKDNDNHNKMTQNLGEKPQIPTTTIPDVIYPELLVALDFDSFKLHNNNLVSLVQYMIAFWNAVDLRYREMSEPKIRLNIAGIIVPVNPDSAPYLESHVLSPGKILVHETLRDFGKFFSSKNLHQKLPNYDIAVGMSNRKLCKYENDTLLSSITGVAFLANACNTAEGKAAAVIKYNNAFTYVTTGAHEVAHSLGAPHDNQESASVPGGPCEWNDGYLMSYKRYTENGQHWSKCSVTAMRNYIGSEQGKCLRNKPLVGQAYPKMLPGRLLTRDQQCQIAMGLNSYKPRENNCAVLYCEKRKLGNKITFTYFPKPPAEGSYCGPRQICLNAMCVLDPELQ